MAQPRLLGIIGDPIGHSLSPHMHNTAIEALGLNYLYVAFAVKPRDLAEAVAGMRALGLVGFNITIPHKEQMLALLHHLTDEARIIGAVNTVRCDGKELIGHNTDGIGLLTSLRNDAGFEPAGTRCVILGAGGASRAVTVQLALAGAAAIDLANRTRARAETLAQHVAAQIPGVQVAAHALDDAKLQDVLATADLIVNTTSIGMQSPDDTPLPESLIRSRHLVCDIVYRPLHTRLLREARKRGARALDGLGMLIHQGSAAFEWWTGQPFPVDRVRQSLIEALNGAAR